MKALVIDGPGRSRIAELPRPEPRADEVLIEVSRCGICGTDIHIYRGEYLGTYPITPGHEFSGTVVGKGSAVKGLAIGDRVAVEPNISCDSCPACLSNRQNFCENWSAVGVTLPGGMAEYVCAQEKAVFKIGMLPFASGAFVEPLSCVLHGVQKARPQLADNILVVGAGPIGLLLIKTLIATGASSITVADKNQGRLAFAKTEGGAIIHTMSSLDELPPDRYDLVVDATGAPSIMGRTIAWVRPGGRILLFGVPPSGSSVSFDAFAIFRKGLEIMSSYTSVRNSIQAIRLMQSGQIDVSHLASHELPLEKFTQGIELIENGTPGVMKILMVPKAGE